MVETDLEMLLREQPVNRISEYVLRQTMRDVLERLARVDKD